MRHADDPSEETPGDGQETSDEVHGEEDDGAPTGKGAREAPLEGI